MTDNPSASTETTTDDPEEPVAGTAQVEHNHPEDSVSTEDGATKPPRYQPPQQESFDWRGWLLVGCIVVSFLVVPGAILYLPYAQEFIGTLGLSWTQAYLVLPMIPAVLLGTIAIWAAVSSRSLSE